MMCRMCEGTLGLDVQYIHGHVLEHMAQVKLGGSASALCLVDSNLKSKNWFEYLRPVMNAPFAVLSRLSRRCQTQNGKSPRKLNG